MKQAYFEDEGSCGVCPILEDTDLDAMTDEQLQKELGNWRAGGDDDPFAWEVDGNYRLVERHIELRAMSDEALDAGIAAADDALERWTPKLDGGDGWLARRIIRTYEGDAKDFRREQSRRAGHEMAAVEDDAAAEANDIKDLNTADLIAALNMHRTPEDRKSAAWSRPADDEEFFDLGKLGDELDLLTGENYFLRWAEWRDEVLSGQDRCTKPVPGVPNLYVETFDNFPVKRVYYEDWMGDPESADDLNDEFLDVGMYGLDTESQHELIAAIAALTPYARDAAERLRPWIDHHTAKLAA